MAVITVSGEVVIQKGTVYNFVENDPGGYPPIEFPDSVPGAPPGHLINYGEINYTLTATYGQFRLITLDQMSSSTVFGIENHGAIKVYASDAGITAIYADASWAGLLNTGTIDVVVDEQAIVFETWLSPGGGREEPLVRNSGSINAKGAAVFALYLANGGEIVNSGLVTATSTERNAIAISFPNGGGVLWNSGQIIASTTAVSPWSVVAVGFYGSDETEIHNTGLIRGTYAVRENNNYNAPWTAASLVDNGGTMEGRVYLGDGDDVLINSGLIDGLIELAGENDLYDGRGGHSVQAVMGGGGDDVLMSGTGVEVLMGEAGDDVFHASLGDKTFDGGEGDDVADFSASATGVTVSLAIAGVQAIGGGASVTLRNVENMVGSANADALAGDDGANRLDGGAGGDTLSGGAGDDMLGGGLGADRIFGGDGADVITGGLGADTLEGGAGADIFIFKQGDGADVITDFDVDRDYLDLASDDGFTGIQSIVQDGADVVLTLSASDSVRMRGVTLAEVLPRVVLLDSAPRVLVDWSGANLLVGGVGDDVLYGLGGSDTLLGGRGDDVLVGGEGGDTIDGGDGVDTVSLADRGEYQVITLGAEGYVASNGAWDKLRNIENVIGGSGVDVIHGDAGGNRIWGGLGADSLYGEAGDDVLDGGAGEDLLYGGAGADLFDFTQTGLLEKDTIQDFQTGLDKIDLRGLDVVDYVLVPKASGGWLSVTTTKGVFWIEVVGQVSVGDILVKPSVTAVTGSTLGENLSGTDNQDVIIGAGGGDHLTGAGGADVFRYLRVSDSAPDSYDILADFQTGSDKLDLTGVTPIEISLIRSGTTTFVFVNTPDGPMTIAAEGDINGSDVLTHDGHGVYMIGDGAANTLIGGASGDVLQSGGGDDILIGGGGGDVLFGQAGADVFKYLEATDSTSAAPDGIFVFETGVDKIDLSMLGAVEVSLIRSGGSTFLFADTIKGPLQLATVGYDLNAGDLVTYMTKGYFMIGDTTADTLIGAGRNDVIQAGAGNDTIIGGGGGDALWGGAGADVFKYLAASDSASGAADTIFDFQSGADKLDLTGVRMGASDVLGVLSSGGASFVFVDLWGDGVTDMTIQLQNTPSLSSGDILF